jgi:hypothetical protein
MTLAIMQPYFFPYIGYFQLINSVDEFVIYDNIQFTKKGWINRNRILFNSNDEYITIPLKKDSDFLNINQRFLADTWTIDRRKLLNRITESYRKSPYFHPTLSLVEKCLVSDKLNLFDFLFNTLTETSNYLDISTKFTLSSSLNIDHNLKSEEKVLSMCKNLHATKYINPIGGLNLYSKTIFEQNSIQLKFLRSNPIHYSQFTNEFLPWLSIIDVMMFNSKNEILNFLNEYTLE